MRIVKTERTSAVIRAKWLVVQRASENPDWARSTRVRHISTDGSANKLLSGATACHLGSGLWELTSARRDGGDIAPAITLMRCQWTPDLAERESRRRDAMMPTWYIKLEAAVETALAASDKYGMPQTVYKTDETCGWTNTNAFANVLNTAELHLTLLPANYFR